jgi:hypothetical protein
MAEPPTLPSTGSPAQPDADLLWKQYSLHVDLYKFYLDLVLKTNVFFYGITGAILTYYFTHQGEPLVSLALLLPLGMSAALCGTFFYGAYLAGFTRREVFSIRDRLGLDSAPDMQVLQVLLRVFGSFLGLVALVILVVILR